jgi:hypothetical protein
MNGATRNEEILATAYRRWGDTLGRSVDDWRSEFLKLAYNCGATTGIAAMKPLDTWKR